MAGCHLCNPISDGWRIAQTVRATRRAVVFSASALLDWSNVISAVAAELAGGALTSIG
jgi:ABC-type taurine transport system ATPase subunit